MPSRVQAEMGQEEAYLASVEFESDEGEAVPPSKINKHDLAHDKKGCAETPAKRCSELSLKMKAYNIRKKSPYLHIPVDFCMKNGLIEDTNLVLKSPGGKQEVGIKICKGGSTKYTVISRGWSDFIATNKLEEGDTCIFKYYGLGTSSEGVACDVEVIKTTENMQPPISGRPSRKPSELVQPTIHKRPIRRSSKRVECTEESSIDSLKSKIVNLEAETTKLNLDLASMRLLYTEQQKQIEKLKDMVQSSSKSGGNVTPGDVEDHGCKPSLDPDIGARQQHADLSNKGSATCGHPPTTHDDIDCKIHKAEESTVEAKLAGRPKRKAAHTPSTDTIQKRKKASLGRIDCPFSKDPFATFSTNEERDKFDAYILDGLVRGHRKMQSLSKYTPEADNLVHLVFEPSLVIERKSWLYRLYQPGQWLDALHVQTIMLYLRVKASVNEYTQKFSTACTYFPGYMNITFDNESDPGEMANDRYFIDETGGDKALHLRAWSESDYVYFPLNVFQQHWVLVVLDVHAGKLRIYDSNNRHGSVKHKVVHELRGIINILPSLLNRSGQPSAFSYEFVKGVPQQENGGDCGFFMLKFAELLQMGVDVKQLDVKKIPHYRAKWAHDLYVYGSEKGKSLVVIPDE